MLWTGSGSCAVLTVYSRIKSTKSLSFCMTVLSLSNLMALLPQSHDCSCYISRQILAPPTLWLWKYTELCTHNFTGCPKMWHQPRLTDITCAGSWRLCGITSVILCIHIHLVTWLRMKLPPSLICFHGMDRDDSTVLTVFLMCFNIYRQSMHHSAVTWRNLLQKTGIYQTSWKMWWAQSSKWSPICHQVTRRSVTCWPIFSSNFLW